MSEIANLKAKLGCNVFKPDRFRNIEIKPGMEKDERLLKAILVCPAGVYSMNSKGEVDINLEGCLECGTCRIACSTEVLDWHYPNGGSGVQFRFG